VGNAGGGGAIKGSLISAENLEVNEYLGKAKFGFGFSRGAGGVGPYVLNMYSRIPVVQPQEYE